MTDVTEMCLGQIRGYRDVFTDALSGVRVMHPFGANQDKAAVATEKVIEKRSQLKAVIDLGMETYWDREMTRPVVYPFEHFAGYGCVVYDLPFSIWVPTKGVR